MSENSDGMVGETTLSRVISGQFEYPKQIARAVCSFVVTLFRPSLMFSSGFGEFHIQQELVVNLYR